MKEKDVILMWRKTMATMAQEQDAPLFIYKIPDPPFIQRPGGGKFPAGRRPYDMEMSWGGMNWHIEFKISKLKNLTKNSFALMSEHQIQALHLRTAAGNGMALLAIYYEARRELYLKKFGAGVADDMYIIERHGPKFLVPSLYQALANFAHKGGGADAKG